MMLARGRSVRSQLSGGTTAPLTSLTLSSRRSAPTIQTNPARHGLLVALVNHPGSPEAESAAWPLWLAPRMARRSGRVSYRSNLTPMRA
jgi:hypothetical protein